MLITLILQKLALSTAIIFVLLLILKLGGVIHKFSVYFREHSKKRRTKAVMEELKLLMGIRRKVIYGSFLSVSVFFIIVLLLMTKIIFFTAVTSDSMRPTFKRGDLVMMQRIHIEPEVGDIVMFEREEFMLPVLHRVVAVSDKGVRTKGDARAFEDPWVVPDDEIIAEAVQINGRPIVLENLGNYFILDAREVRVGRYGSEYAFMINLFKAIKMWGYALFIIATAGYIFLVLREGRGR